MSRSPNGPPAGIWLARNTDHGSDMSEPNQEKPDDSKKPQENPDFEAAIIELEDLVARLEKGELSLDDSLQQFKRGVELTRRCQKFLDDAQQVVEQLSDPTDESSAVELDSSD